MTMTLSGTTGIVLPTNAAPAFAVYRSSAVQTLSANTYTKVIFDTEYFDTNSNYDTTTYRFTPTVAGYYQINIAIAQSENSSGSVQNFALLYKNGSAYASAQNFNPGQPLNTSFSCIVSMNGSTDYLEVYAWGSGGIPLVSNGGINKSIFSGCLIRSA